MLVFIVAYIMMGLESNIDTGHKRTALGISGIVDTRSHRCARTAVHFGVCSFVLGKAIQVIPCQIETYVLNVHFAEQCLGDSVSHSHIVYPQERAILYCPIHQGIVVAPAGFQMPALALTSFRRFTVHAAPCSLIEALLSRFTPLVGSIHE